MKNRFFALPFRSLKGRLIVYLLLYALIPLLLLGTVSLTSIQNILNKNVESGIRSNLEKTKVSLENTLSNMEYVSYQLYLDGHVGQKLTRLLAEQRKYEQMDISSSIRGDINFLNFTNPNLGLMLYYFPNEQEVKFQNLEIKKQFAPEDQPLLTEMNGEYIYGPHPTAYRYGNNTVFSLIRPMHIPGTQGKNVYIYMETNFKLFEEILKKSENGMNVTYVVFNQNQEMIYGNEDKALDEEASKVLFRENMNVRSTVGNYYAIADTSEQGWSVAVFIHKHDFDGEFRGWLIKFAWITSICLIISVLLALFVWRSIYGPLKTINREIRLMGHSQYDSPVKVMKIAEFDDVLREFQRMREKVLELFAEIESKERVKARLEVEKLLHQINPHFIHNTLNTIQWIARMNGQEEIDRLVSIFTRVLHYNLGKEGGLVKVSQELEALKDYISLQEIRYDHTFNVRYEVEDRLLQEELPRFILQPVVENALYHGLDEQDGMITIRIQSNAASTEMIIEVSDNGGGMTEKEMEQIVMLSSTDERRKSGLGIGLNYVYRMVKSHYGEDSAFEVNSKLGSGTTIRFRIPINQSVSS